jgi:hypothetical protein
MFAGLRISPVAHSKSLVNDKLQSLVGYEGTYWMTICKTKLNCHQGYVL